MFPRARSELETVFSCVSSHPIFTMVIVLLFGWQDLTGCQFILHGRWQVIQLLQYVRDSQHRLHCSDTGVYFYFTYIFRVCRTVTSLPYSMSSRSRWYGYRVCDMEVIVEGPCHRLQDVCTALGSTKNFTTLDDLCNDTNDADNKYDTDSHTCT